MNTINIIAQSDLESDQSSTHQQPILYLWQFIIHLLSDERLNDIISWTDNEYEFKVLDLKEVNNIRILNFVSYILFCRLADNGVYLKKVHQLLINRYIMQCIHHQKS